MYMANAAQALTCRLDRASTTWPESLGIFSSPSQAESLSATVKPGMHMHLPCKPERGILLVGPRGQQVTYDA